MFQASFCKTSFCFRTFLHTDSVFQRSHSCIPCKPKNTRWHHWAMHWHQEYGTKPTEVVGSQNCAGNSSSQLGQTNFWNHSWFKNCDPPRVLADPTPCHAQRRWQHFSPPQPSRAWTQKSLFLHLGKQLFLLPGSAPFPYSLAPLPEPIHVQWATHPAGEEGLGGTVSKRFKILLMNTIWTSKSYWGALFV